MEFNNASRGKTERTVLSKCTNVSCTTRQVIVKLRNMESIVEDFLVMNYWVKPALRQDNNTRSARTNMILRRVPVSTVAVKKQ